MGEVHQAQRRLLRVELTGSSTPGRPASATDLLLRNAHEFFQRYDPKGWPRRPAHRVAIMTCMDARLSPFTLMGLQPGDAHVLRNAGGIVTDDMIRSLAYSQHLLGTREIVLIQHTQCGLLGSSDDDLLSRLPERPPWEPGTFPDLEESVRGGTRRLRESPFLEHTESVRGFVFEMETGRLREVE